jgi:hypothetical protein
VWIPGVSGPDRIEPVFLHLDLDGFRPDMMSKDGDGAFRVMRMLPAKTIRYFYSFDGVARTADDQPKEALNHPYNTTI